MSVYMYMINKAENAVKCPEQHGLTLLLKSVCLQFLLYFIGIKETLAKTCFSDISYVHTLH